MVNSMGGDAGPFQWSEAIRAESVLERRSLERVRQHMASIMQIPVVRAAALMPDASPAGGAPGTMPVGAVVASEAIHPAFHSSDICCSMYATFFPVEKDTARVMDELTRVTCFGQGPRDRKDRYNHDILSEAPWDNPFLKGFDDIASSQLGHQGDGNHFAFFGDVEFPEATVAALADNDYENLASFIRKYDGRLSALVTHHGSRGLGAKVYKRGQDKAEKLTRKSMSEVLPLHAWIPADSREGIDYWAALEYVSRWTLVNHKVIHEALMKRLGVKRSKGIGNEHNFVWKRGDLYYHGKGATPAWNHERGRRLGLIPLNMASPVLMVLGRANDDFLSFAPHGAGRNTSRAAIEQAFMDSDGEIMPHLVQEEIARTCPGLDVRWFAGRPDVTESPIGYKDPAKIQSAIQEYQLADIVAEIKPRGSLMAGIQEPTRNRRHP